MILLDLMMPEMDGFEFLDPLAARVAWREIPVIVITAKQLTAAERYGFCCKRATWLKKLRRRRAILLQPWLTQFAVVPRAQVESSMKSAEIIRKEITC
jgi:CheY-like chemotaxis protein